MVWQCSFWTLDNHKSMGKEMSNYWQHHNHRKIEPEDVVLIKALRNEGLKLTEIAEKFELTKSHVSKIVNNKTWKHLGNEI